MQKGLPVKGIVYDPLKERVDRFALAQALFEDFSFSAKLVETVIQLLASPEEALVIKALHHLDQFAMKYIKHYEVLYQKQILAALYGHLGEGHLFRRRFAWKLLSQMFVVPEANLELMENEEVFKGAAQTFAESDDNFLMEYTGIVLNQLVSNSPLYLDRVIESPVLPKLLLQLKTTSDPDVLLQTLQLLARITALPLGLSYICDSKVIEALLSSLLSEFLTIQSAAIEVLVNLTRSPNPTIRSALERPNIMEKIFEILENNDLMHLHLKTIELLRQMLKRPNIAELFYKDVSLDRFMEFANTTTDFRNEAVGVLSELAGYADARPILHTLGLTDILVDIVATEELGNIATGIIGMSSYPGAIETFLNRNVVEKLFAVLKNPLKKLEDRKAAAQALNGMFEQSEEACNKAFECGGIDELQKLLGQPILPIELKFQLIHMLNSLGKHEPQQRKVMTFNMAGQLLNTLKSSVSCNMFLVEVMQCMLPYLCIEPLREQLLNVDFSSTLHYCLTDESLPAIVQKSAVDLIIGCGPYPELTDLLIDTKILNVLHRDTTAMANCPNWSRAIDIILANNLPVKFATCGRLDMDDITLGTFYATKKIWDHPRRLRHIMLNDLAPRKPIFVSAFDTKGGNWSNASLNSWITKQSQSKSQTVPESQRDEDLHEYLRILQEAMEIDKITSKPESIQESRRCVEILSDLVCRKICSKPFAVKTKSMVIDTRTLPSTTTVGTDDALTDEGDLLQKSVTEHLDKLKIKYDYNILPIGSIRIGAHFEKSMLFKVLADQVGLACTLRMDPEDNRMVWNEVEIREEDGCEDSTPTPKPTHVVDLMQKPGNLYALGSPRAMQYLSHSSLDDLSSDTV